MTTEIKRVLSCLYLAPLSSLLVKTGWILPPLPDGASHWEIHPVPFKSTGLDFNAHDPSVPRAGCTAADRGQALWDVMTVMAGRRALGSIHADETRGGMDEIGEMWPIVRDCAANLDTRQGTDRVLTLYSAYRDKTVGLRIDILVWRHTDIGLIAARHGLVSGMQSLDDELFLRRSLTETFPVGSPERAVIDAMYGEESQ